MTTRSRFDPNRVLNPLRERRIYRKRIPRVENVVSGAILAVLIAAGVWVLLQRNAYDPRERDLSSEALLSASVVDTLYQSPLKPWIEPGQPPVAGAPVQAAGPDLGLFPREILDGGWTVDGRVETYDPTNVYEKIDGAAEQYLAFGFRRLYYVTLVKAGTFLTIEVYDQGDFPGTLGIFAAQRDPSGRVERSGKAFFYRTAVGALGIADNHYFKVMGSTDGPEVRAKADALVPLLAALPASGTAAGLGPFRALTEGLKLPFEAIAFEKTNVFDYDFLGDTWFGRAKGGDARWFLHEEKSDAAAAALLTRVAAEQANEHTPVDATADRKLLKHKFLGTFFAVARRGSVLYGVESAADRATAETMLAQLERHL